MNGGQLVLGETAWPTDAELREADKRARAAATVRAPVRDDEPERTPERAHARRSDPETSHAAAESISTDRLRRSQEAVLAVFDELGGRASDSQVAVRYSGPRQSPSGLRTRRRELVDLGYLRDSGERVMLPSGRRSIVWERTPGGTR